MPRHKICKPPINHIEQIVLDHPSSAAPRNFAANAHINAITLRNTIIKPMLVIILSGFTLNDVIPFIANASIFFSGYLLSPAKRSFLS